MKDLAERVSCEMGLDGELTPEVLREAQCRLDYLEMIAMEDDVWCPLSIDTTQLE
jgi:hypothetical protein